MSRRFTIGRERQCDVAVFDDSVSRLHAEIWLAEDGSLMMSDCGSANGTTVVRGQEKFPLRQEVMLPGDLVRMGGVMLSVQEMVEAVEARNPGALTPRTLTPHAVLPPPPSLPPPPPIAYQMSQYQQHDPSPSLSSPPPASRPAPAPGAPLVRCECGAIKAQGQFCPVCQR
jgi:predicted component of type VI protein secretion system